MPKILKVGDLMSEPCVIIQCNECKTDILVRKEDAMRWSNCWFPICTKCKTRRVTLKEQSEETLMKLVRLQYADKDCIVLEKDVVRCSDCGSHMVYISKWTDLEGSPGNDCIKCKKCNSIIVRF